MAPRSLTLREMEELCEKTTTSRFLTPKETYEKMRASGEQGSVGPALFFKLPCDCRLCTEQWWTVEEQREWIHQMYTGYLNDEAAALTARQLRNDIFGGFDFARSVMMAHGNQIKNWWLKKSNTKRRSFLKQLRPGMIDSEATLMDISMFEDVMETRRHREALLHPYLNLKTFSTDGTTLLNLLHHRVYNAPESWVPFDNYQLFPAWRTGSLEEKYNFGCVTMYGKAYGEWKLFDKVEGV